MNLIITDNLVRAWQSVKGSKWPIWAASLAWIGSAGIILLIAWVISFFIPPAIAFHPITILSLTWVIIMITAPLFAGMNMIAIKHVRGEPISIRTGFQYFHRWGSLAGAFAVISVLSAALILIFSLFLNVIVLPFVSPNILNHWIMTALFACISVVLFNLAYALLMFVVPLIADRRLSIRQSLQQSLPITKTHWLPLFTLLILFYGLNLLSLLICEIPFIGLICYIVINIWLLPFIFLNIGVAYNQLLG